MEYKIKKRSQYSPGMQNFIIEVSHNEINFEVHCETKKYMTKNEFALFLKKMNAGEGDGTFIYFNSPSFSSNDKVKSLLFLLNIKIQELFEGIATFLFKSKCLDKKPFFISYVGHWRLFYHKVKEGETNGQYIGIDL
jgi:hypothetical protein